MTVRELINELECYDGDMEVRIGMRQDYGSNFAMEISNSIGDYDIDSFYGDNIKAVILTEGSQIGIVDYEDEG